MSEGPPSPKANAVAVPIEIWKAAVEFLMTQPMGQVEPIVNGLRTAANNPVQLHPAEVETDPQE